MKLLEIENVIVFHNNDVFKIMIDNKEEIKAERYENGWILWDHGESLLFNVFNDVAEHIKDLAQLYNLFPKNWHSQYYNAFLVILWVATSQNGRH
jgi:hypothetical protein